jgi:hypothetical protein
LVASRFDLGEMGNFVAPGLDETKIVNFQATGPSLFCGGADAVVNVAYPVGPWPKELAILIRQEAIAEFQDRQKEWLYLEELGPCQDPEGSEALKGASSYTRSVRVEKSSANFLSVFFIQNNDMVGAAHPTTNFLARNYDLKTGQRVTLGELFPNLKEAGPKLWRGVAEAWLASEAAVLPSYYGTEWSEESKAIPPPPPQFLSPSALVADLGHAVLTSEGLTLALNGYEMGYYALGYYQLKIPKSFLLAMGANPKFWAASIKLKANP